MTAEQMATVAELAREDSLLASETYYMEARHGGPEDSIRDHLVEIGDVIVTTGIRATWPNDPEPGTERTFVTCIHPSGTVAFTYEELEEEYRRCRD